MSLFDPIPAAALGRVRLWLDSHSYHRVLRLPSAPASLWGLPAEIFLRLEGRRDPLFHGTGSWLYRLATRRFRQRHPRTFILYKLFVMCEEMARSELETVAAPSLVAELVAAGLLVQHGGPGEGAVRAVVRILPYGGFYFLCSPRRTGGPDAWRNDQHVFLGGDSVILGEALLESLADLARNGPLRRGLDLCCGTGIHAHLMASHCEEVVGLDRNEQAVRFARANAALNGVPGLRFLESDLCAALEGPVDVIACNPPYVMMPEAHASTNRHGYGGRYGMELPLRALQEGLARLSRTGLMVSFLSAPVIRGTNLLLEAPASHLPPAHFHLEEVAFFRGSYGLWHWHEFYAQHGISHFVLYLVRARPGPGLSLRITRMPDPRRSLARLKTQLLLRRLLPAAKALQGPRTR